jgi:hypothetical protein
MRRVLRNRIAEWLLEALADPGAAASVRALIRFAKESDAHGCAAALGAGEAGALASEERLFERTPCGVELREDLLGDLEELRGRLRRFESALDHCRRTCGGAPVPWRSATIPASGGPPSGAEIAWSLCAAAALFDAELFFEVHELLEPPWGRAEGALRTFLQGLIQVAVGFHHRSTGNLRGAVALLADGNAKLRPFVPEAWGVSLAGFCRDVDAVVATLRDEPGTAADVVPPRLLVRKTP